MIKLNRWHFYASTLFILVPYLIMRSFDIFPRNDWYASASTDMILGLAGIFALVVSLRRLVIIPSSDKEVKE